MRRLLALVLILAPAAGAQEEATGGVAGTIKLKGKVRVVPPKPPPDPACAAACPGGIPHDELAVDKDGRLQWAFAWVKSGLGGRKFEPPKTPAVLDQKGCHYMPHVFGVMAGQPVEFVNSDTFLHNVHGYPFENAEFNVSLLGGEKKQKTFSRPEMMVKIACDIHPWMRAWMYVMEHPFYSVTDVSGKFAISGLPAGRYVIAVRHPKLGSAEGEVEIKAKETATLDFELEKK